MRRVKHPLTSKLVVSPRPIPSRSLPTSPQSPVGKLSESCRQCSESCRGFPESCRAGSAVIASYPGSLLHKKYAIRTSTASISKASHFSQRHTPFSHPCMSYNTHTPGLLDVPCRGPVTKAVTPDHFRHFRNITAARDCGSLPGRYITD